LANFSKFYFKSSVALVSKMKKRVFRPSNGVTRFIYITLIIVVPGTHFFVFLSFFFLGLDDEELEFLQNLFDELKSPV